MRMPGFAAEDSLYKTSGHYRSGRRAVNLHIQTNSAVYPTMEVIEVSGCRPGFIELGEGDNMVCIPDPSWAGGGQTGTPGVPTGGGPGGPGGGGGGRPSRPKRPPRDPLQKCGCHITDFVCRINARFNRLKHEACEKEIDKCVSQYCQGKTHAELGKCEQDCTDIVGRGEVCQSDPCFGGVPCTRRPDGTLECNPIPGCPGTYGEDESC